MPKLHVSTPLYAKRSYIDGNQSIVIFEAYPVIEVRKTRPENAMIGLFGTFVPGDWQWFAASAVLSCQDQTITCSPSARRWVGKVIVVIRGVFVEADKGTITWRERLYFEQTCFILNTRQPLRERNGKPLWGHAHCWKCSV